MVSKVDSFAYAKMVKQRMKWKRDAGPSLTCGKVAHSYENFINKVRILSSEWGCNQDQKWYYPWSLRNMTFAIPSHQLDSKGFGRLGYLFREEITWIKPSGFRENVLFTRCIGICWHYKTTSSLQQFFESYAALYRHFPRTLCRYVILCHNIFIGWLLKTV